MRNVWRMVFGLAVAAFVVNSASAQQPRRPGGGGFGGGLTTLASNKSVQEELKVTDEQKTKLEDVSKKNREAIQKKMEGVARDKYFEKLGEVTKEMAPETEKSIAAVLKDDQVKRLKQIQRQQMGTRAFTNDEVVKALSIGDDQKKELAAIIEEGSKKVQEETKDLNFMRDGEKMREIRTKVNKETMGKVAAKLSADQKKTWKELTGEPFEVKFEQRRPGQGGTRPGGTRPGTPGTPQRPGTPNTPQRPRTDLSF